MTTIQPRTRATLRVGDTGSFSKTVSELDVFKFADVTGDFNPLHVDEEYARKSIFKRRIAHGILIAGIISTVLGSEIPGVGTVFVELEIKFLKPVFLGDTVTATATVLEIPHPRRVRLLVACRNAAEEDVALGNALVVPPVDTRLII